MLNVAIVYHSKYGHTKLQAEAVERGARSVSGATVRLLTAEEATEQLDELDSVDAIIFGCPTYMGNMSAGMKSFLEAAAGKWSASAWKDKIAGAFTNSSSFSGDKLNTLMGLAINAMQHGMIFVGTGMLPAPNRQEEMKSINGPGPEAHNRVGSWVGPMSASFQVQAGTAPAIGDIETAEAYGRRVTEIAAQFAKARKS